MHEYKAPYSELANLKRTREVLSEHGFYTKQRLGQNFLVQDAIVGKILQAAKPRKDELILEVGPGIGTLSLALLKQGVRLISVEMDRELPQVLKRTLSEFWDNFNLIQKDALQLRHAELAELCARRSYASDFPAKLVANLPYQIAATLILKYFQEFSEIEMMCIMVQSEVADRITAAVRSKNYSSYTVKLALFAQVTERFQVPPHAFEPRPRVDSSVIVLRRISSEYEPAYLRQVCDFIDKAFSQRRKTLRNNLKPFYQLKHLEESCAALHIQASSRAEELSAQQFVELYRQLTQPED